MEHGLILVKPTKEDYKQGSKLRLGGLPLVSDGQWDSFVPPDELQDKGFSSMACTSFGTLNCVEALERQEFGDTTEYSDRFLAGMSGTTQYGNDPNTVAETLRKKGCALEADWPYGADITTWGQFYQTPPYNIITSALQFIAEYDFGHEWGKNDQASMMDALRYSPLGVTVYAWNQPDSDGIYHRNGMSSEHWVMIYGFVANHYWKCFDSYDNTHKKLAWDFGFELVKKYTLHKQVIREDWWVVFVRQFRTLLGL